MRNRLVLLSCALSAYATNPASVDYVNQQDQILQNQIDDLSTGYIAGTGIDITGDVISGDYVAGTGIEIAGNVISTASTTSYTIGQYAQGGVIFWLTPDKTHGVVADIIDLDGGSGVAWSIDTSSPIGAKASRSIVFGADYETPGSINTELIVSSQGSSESYAALLCTQRSVTVDGVTYDDWYLPSIDELGTMLAMQATIDAVAISHGGAAFASERYWSSDESSSTSASVEYFSTGFQTSNNKSSLLRVRAARAF